MNATPRDGQDPFAKSHKRIQDSMRAGAPSFPEDPLGEDPEMWASPRKKKSKPKNQFDLQY